MQSKMLLSAVIGNLLFSSSLAHMVMKSPVPFGQTSLTNGPLAADGSDFPCKQRAGVYDITKMNSISVGTPQSLNFMGSAVHGGGSCQVSITLDEKPTKDSKFKVIHSIIGGCPSNVTGNLPENANGLLAATFDFKVPQGFPNGKATLAWSWLNKVGNREFYMNCAPIEISGGSNDKTFFNSLPDMFVANIGPQCGTAEGQDFVFPNPGDSVETRFSTALGSKTVGASCQKPTQGASSGQTDTGAKRPAAQGIQADTTTTSSPAAASPTKNTPSAINLNVALTTTTAAAVAITTSTAPAQTTVAAPAVATGNTSNGTCDSASVACPNPGSVVCVGAAQWGLCDINNCAVIRELAIGTTCKDGTISKRSIDRHLARHLMNLKSNI